MLRDFLTYFRNRRRRAQAWKRYVQAQRLLAIYRGPAAPNGTPTPTHSLENLNERLERLAFGRRPEGFNAPPLETYTTTTTENGDVVRATPEYIRWFLRAYPAAGPENRLSRAAPRPPAEGVGGEKSPLSHFKAT